MVPGANLGLSDDRLQRFVDAFYVDLYYEVRQYGVVEDIILARNSMFHLCGNAYVWYRDLGDANLAQKALDGRYYAGKKVRAVVTSGVSFSRSVCRTDHGAKRCRDEYCNFIHEMKVSPDLYKELFPPELRAKPDGQHREWKIPIIDPASLIFAEIDGQEIDGPLPS
jgi:splicing factor U2AF subunit